MAITTYKPRTGLRTQAEPYQLPHRTEATRFIALNVFALANAASVVAWIGYLLCAAIALVSMDLLVGFLQLWFHGLALQAPMGGGPALRLDALVVGLITFGLAVWAATAATAAFYNAFARR